MNTEIFFDLDGTLSDSAPGIFNGLHYARQKSNLRMLSREELNSFIGPPMLNSLMCVWELDENNAEKVLALYREYYNAKGIFENTLYPGIKELLDKLTSAGIKCGVCSAKPEVMVHTVLEYFDIKKYFCDIFGAPLHGDYCGKGKILHEFSKKNKRNIIMVGDRGSDISGAHTANAVAVGVLWGYGSKEELKDADFLISNPSEILDILPKMPEMCGFN